METHFFTEMGGACGYFLAGLVLLIVGAVSARPVEPRAGYLAMGAGGAILLDGCCGVIPSLIMQTGTGYELYGTMFSCNTWLGLLLLFVQGAAIIGAAVLLTRAILAQPGAA